MQYTRTYSISSAPERDDECITITVKAIAGGRMSHHLVRKIQVGDFLPIGVPQGENFVALPDAVPGAPLVHQCGQRHHADHEHAAQKSDRQGAGFPDVTHIHYVRRILTT